MQWKGIKVPVVVMALVLGLASFWAAQWLFNRFNYDRPLAKILGDNREVVSYEIKDQGPVLELVVKLGKVENLQLTYENLVRSLEGILGSREYRLVVKDGRNQVLEEIYYHARLAAYEAIEKGNYLEMEEYVSGLAARQGSRARVHMDGNYLYIQIDHGSNYLYEIIPRAGPAGAASPAGGERGNPS